MGLVLLSLFSFFCSFQLCLSNFTASDPVKALLAFKAQITHDPFGALSSWNESTDLCKWSGVSCSRKHPERIISLNLHSQDLSGHVSPSIGNLTFLKILNLSHNNFVGEIPTEIGHLRRLQYLLVRNNSFQGGIPVNLSNCSNLKNIDLSHNFLTGRIPVELSSLLKLNMLVLHMNKLTGEIPPWLGNLSSLLWLGLVDNNFEGRIPVEIGNLRSLKLFQASANMLHGDIPSSLFNLSSLTEFGVAQNLLRGKLPSSMGTTLPRLTDILFQGNQFEGPIPVSLFNATDLVLIDFSDNIFSGKVPSSLGLLQNLTYLALQKNHLHANDVDDWKFVEALTNCSHLSSLSLELNLFKGKLPVSIANLSTKLELLTLGSNRISGSIPFGIGNLVSLNKFGLHGNLLFGNIPEDFGQLKMLEHLFLFSNRLTSSIPSSIGNLTKLSILFLDDNELEGEIPPSFGNLQHMELLDLSNNRLRGSIPKELISFLYTSRYMNLSHNFLVGAVPFEVGSLRNLEALDLSANQLSGEIPSTLSNCYILQHILMDNNLFEGSIPNSLGNIKGLVSLDLSNNNLSGPIPEILGSLSYVEFLDLSLNNLSGEVPTKGVFANVSAVSLFGNDALCGGLIELHLPACPMKIEKPLKKIKFGVIVAILLSASSFFIIVVFSIFFFIKKSDKKLNESPSDDHYPKVSYAELARATNGFSSTNLIGSGKYGSVYRGSLEQIPETVAVKVFNLQQAGASTSFMTECEALRNIRHRNIIKILTSCSSIDSQCNEFKALVFEFMPNGSLEEWLHHPMNSLSLLQRLNIAIDIACALDYLHNDCQSLTVHCDLKPGNILLDHDMTPRLGDFGLAKVFPEATDKFLQTSSSIGIRGSIGYIAPEYGTGRVESSAGDMYSYGIILLELFTEKRPVDDAFKDGLTLPGFAATALPERIMDIIDPSLFMVQSDDHYSQSGTVKCLVSVVKVGLSCSKPSPDERTGSRDVVDELRRARGVYIGDGAS